MKAILNGKEKEWEDLDGKQGLWKTF